MYKGKQKRNVNINPDQIVYFPQMRGLLESIPIATLQGGKVNNRKLVLDLGKHCFPAPSRHLSLRR